MVRSGPGGLTSRWEDLPDPVAPAHGVVVAVAAAALAWSDVLQMRGEYAGQLPDPPFVAGHEFAGTVVEAGAGSEFRTGERVFGFLPAPAAFADYVPVADHHLRRTPATLTDIQAATVTTSFVTADLGLFEVGRLVPGESLLVNAAAGGVGRCAVELAVLSGVEVIAATAGSEARRHSVIEAGVSAVSDYAGISDMVAELTAGAGVDVALESVGGEVFDATARALAPLGRLVTIGASSGEAPQRLKLPLLWQRSISVCGVHIGRLALQRPEIVERSWIRLHALLDAGRLTPPVAVVLPADDIGAGIDALRSRTVDGRVVLTFGTGGERP